MWTRFMDMSLGGGKKLAWRYIYIEADEQEAVVIFYNRFGRSPYRVTCTCCGPDYSISSEESLTQLTGYARGCAYSGDERRYLETPDTGKWAKPYLTLEQYRADPKVLIIPAEEVALGERMGRVPDEGYIWH